MTMDFMDAKATSFKYIWLVTILICVGGCGDSAIEERLKTLSGNDYLALSQEQKNDLVEMSLNRYTSWKFWDRPDLCDHVLSETSLSSLYEKSAQNAKDNLFIHSFVVYANEECIEQGQMWK